MTEAFSPDYSAALERFAQDFETDTAGYLSQGGSIAFEASGSNGVDSAGGNAHARIAYSDEGGVFTRLGGYRSADDLGFITSVQVYLDTDMLTGEGFAYSVAANGPDNAHQRDFAFHVAKDTSTGQLQIGTDNGSDFQPHEHLEDQLYTVISNSGWYTFEHKFYENESGDLEVAMNIYNSDDLLLFSETRSNVSDDFVSEYGGNRYGWFTNVDVTGGIAIDNARLATLDTNPVQVFSGTNVLGTYASVAAAKAAIDAHTISGATLFVETSGGGDGFFYVGQGMSIQSAVNAAAIGGTVSVGAGTFTEQVTVDKDVTVLGANSGVAHDGTRGTESTLSGGFVITAAGVTIDGFSISGGRLDYGYQRSGFFISGAQDGVTITNNLIDAGASAESELFGIITTFGADTDALSVTGNSITGWASGMYLNPGLQGSNISGNAFTDNGNHIIVDDPDSLTITNNAFGLSEGSKIGVGAFDGVVDMAAELGLTGNTFTTDTGGVTVFPYGAAGQEILGTTGAERLRGDFGSPDVGRIFEGRGGADFIVGGSGVDTARYADDLDASDIAVDTDVNEYSAGDQAGWGINGDGGDSITGIERVVDGTGEVFLLVGNGGFATIQAAVNAAASGDTILVADGTYAENVVISVSGITLLSLNGRGAVTIEGVGAGAQLGTVQLTPGVNNVTIGGTGHGFTIIGIDGTGPIERAAVYLQGAHDAVNIFDNEIVAAGDAGLMSEFDGAITNLLIDGNEFSGQTFTGSQPSGNGFGTQFDLGNNAPRQLVVLGNGNNAQLSSNITFTNNLVSGTTGGFSSDPGNPPQGNNLLTIDAKNSTISDNEFTGYTDRFATAIRARGENTDIENNILNDAAGQSRGISVANQGVPGSYSGNVVNGGATADIITSMTDGADELNGNGGDDYLSGSGGADDISGGAGHDTLIGGDGIDTAHYDSTLTAASFVASGDHTSWTVAGDGGDIVTGVERVVDGTGKVFLLVGNGGYSTIQAALAAAENGDTIVVANGTYELGASTLTFDKEVKLVGQSEAGVIINGAGIDGYGILVNADNVSLSNFTLHGPQAGSPSANYGIKVEPNTNAATDRLLNFTLENATIDSSGRAEVDLNGVLGATITNVTVDGNNTAGVGIGISDSANVTLTDIETIDNGWGSIGIYNSNQFFNQQVTNITFAGTYSANEVIGIYTEKSAPLAQPIGTITFPPSFTGDGDGVWTVTNDAYRGTNSPNFTFYFADEADAKAFALGLQGAPNTANKLSVVTDPDGNQHVFAGMSLQAAIDASDAGDSIFVHPGNYTEVANYNQADNTNSGSNPLGLLINKSVTIAGVDANGDVITDVTHVAATITASVQSNWSTSFFVTADNVTITGLSFLGATPGGSADKVFEIIKDGFELTDSKVGTVSGDIGSAIYINDEVASNAPGFVSAIGSFNIHDNILQGDFVVTNGPGLNRATQFILANNDFIRNPGSTPDYNWGVIITGRDDAVDWRIASVGGELHATGNTFASDYTTDRLLFVRDDDATKLPSALFVENFIANNHIGSYAYGVSPGGVPSVITTNTTQGFVLAKTAGDGSSWVHAGDTLIVKTDGIPATETIVTDNLTVELRSSGLDLVLDSGVVTLALAGSANGDVSGNGEDNVITGNSGKNDISGGAGNDELFGGAGDDNITGNGGADLIDGGDGNDHIDAGTGKDTVYFSAGSDYANGGAGIDTLALAGTSADYSIVILGAGHYAITRGDGAYTEAVNFENISFVSAVTLDALNDSFGVDAGGIRTLNVRGNDTGSGSVIAANITSGLGTVTLGSDSLLGSVINLDLTTAYKSLDVGQTATVTILYLLSDGNSSDTAQVTVFVSGAADDIGAVTDNNLATANQVSEGLAAGAAVGITALAVDPDAGSTVTYSLISNPNGAFQINANTGVVTTTRALDREGSDGSSQIITVQAKSSDNTTNTASFTIAINDVNDTAVSAPVDINGVADAVNENAATGTLVNITASASDPDVGDGNIVYSLDDDAGGAFQINNQGIVSVLGPIDRETNATLSITVRATSPDASYALTTFVIAVNDVNDHNVTAPVDTFGVPGGAVTENAVNGTSVGIFASASDGDVTNNAVSYSLTDTAGGQFSINSVTGEVSVAGAINREIGATRSITVRATSADHSTADSVFAIDVADVDEFNVLAPTDSLEVANVVTSTSIGSSTGVQASAADADATTNTITYSLIVGDADFDIDATSGLVTVGAGFNPSGASTRLITVQAASADGSTASTIFSINYIGGETTVTGTVGKDTLEGTATRNIIYGLEGNDTLLGYGGNDTLYGAEGNDIMKGGEGNDEMVGGSGNDSYFIDAAGDMVTEAGGGGTRDVVYSDISIVSLFNNVEELILNGAGNLDGTGNGLANKLTGNSGVNVLAGGDGKDTLNGLGGNDLLFGGEGLDLLNGGAGDDRLTGGAARDTLTGGAGNDKFVFDFVPGTAATADVVVDFSRGDDNVDKVALSHLAFGALGGTIEAGEFIYGLVALDSDDHLIFDKGTGRLFYDADGVGGNAAKLIATFDGLTGDAALKLADFDFLF